MEIEVADVYAKALFDASMDAGNLDETREDLKALKKILESEKDFRMVLLNPAISAEKKKTMIHNVFGGRVTQYVESFLCILAERGRLSYFPLIVRRFKNMYNAETGVSKGILFTVFPVEPDKIPEIERKTSKLLRENVHLKNKPDKSLIGGFRIQVNGKLIDGSYKTALQKMAKRIKSEHMDWKGDDSRES